MYREFTSCTKLARSFSAVAAIVSTVLIMSGIVGLAHYYSGEPQLAHADVQTERA